MRHLFLTYLGNTDLIGMDLKSSRDNNTTKRLGPLLFILKNILDKHKIDQLIIINDYSDFPKEVIQHKLYGFYKGIKIEIINARELVKNYNPSRHTKIAEVFDKIFPQNDDINTTWHINLTSGTPTIIFMLLLYAKTKLINTKFYQTYYDKENNCEKMEISDIPFNIFFSKIKNIIQKELLKKPLSNTIIGNSKEIKIAINKARRIALFDIPCFIFGETGTGKELFANEIYKNNGKRNKKKFIAINCSALTDELALSELFGYKKGAFTDATTDKIGILEKCDGGTVFLDEIGDLSLSVQTKLLRFLQEGTFIPLGDTKEKKADVLIIAATHKNIYEMINKGTFREDLFYRIAVEIINLPPLRNRKEDIKPIAEHLLDKINKEFANISSDNFTYNPKTLSQDAVVELEKHKWRGNIRELAHVLKRAAIWCDDNQICAQHIKMNIINIPYKDVESNLPNLPIDLKKYITDLEKKIIYEALSISKHKQNKAAELLGMDKTTLNKKIKKFNEEKL